MSNLSITIESINQLKPENVASDETVKGRFIQIYDAIHGEGGESFYEQESHYFKKIVSDSDNLKKCTPFSFFTCFIDIAVCGLSLEPGAKALSFLIPRSYKIGKAQNGNDIYEPRCTLFISGYGELVLRSRVGQIKYADDPVVLYANDGFSAYERDGRKHVDYTCNLPHAGQSIIGCYIRIVRADGSVDYSWTLMEEIERLMSYSAKNNKKWSEQERKYLPCANELYTSQNGGIDSGFLRAKTIKHAFSSYPKVRIGSSTVLSTQDETSDYYGIEPEKKENSEPFGEQDSIAGGVRVDTKSENIQDDGAF